MGQVIECAFSLLDTRRKYTGNHRNYIIENARKICYAPATLERIKNREAFGFYGHGRRLLCGKMDLQEVDVITLPNGKQAMVSNIPSNVTTQFDVDADGMVSHAQEILDTETGKIVAGLNASKVGGFSWACPGKVGQGSEPTIITGFSGFDYVLAPGFSANRGYVLESAQGDIILESVAAIVGDDRRAEQLVEGWRYDGDRIASLQDAIFESERAFCELKDENAELMRKLKASQSQITEAKELAGAVRSKFQGVLESIRDSLPFFIPDAVMDEMLEGDFMRARGVFESAMRVDFSQYPLVDRNARKLPSMPNLELQESQTPYYGSSQYGFEIDI